ncbi:MAG: hypothetical protein BWY77_01648 [bacterium ADurb.Bin431]|nr:MAG: hypothetical protein BWY77_01648 [bacterium ADurb.Bin431]HNY92114.1 hypothetical protein [bacterium]HOC23992.1 hypothetical protein [bacterium]HOH07307.1 hypothetical protein [bacterium]HOY43763.1 hypothetical protein [bacterium]
MKHFIALLAMITFLFFLSLSVNIAQDEALRLNRMEMESMLNLLDHSAVKGSDIDGLADLCAKLRAGARQVALFPDSSRTVVLKVTPREAKICLGMIENATIQARNAEMVQRIRIKLLHYASSV